jgi:hypothetical protein
MKIYDVSSFNEFKPAFVITKYDDLVTFFSQFNKRYYDERSIYVERHHVVPRSEGGTDEDGLVYLPFYYHFRAHVLRAIEYDSIGNASFANKNYYAAAAIVHLRKFSRSSIEDLLTGLPISTYDYKQKFIDTVAERMHSLPQEVENERCRKISEHNRSREIALAKDDPIVCLETGEVFKNYTNVVDTLRNRGVEVSNFHRALRNGTTCNGLHWSRYCNDMNVQKELENVLQKRKDVKKRGYQISAEKQFQRKRPGWLQGWRYYTNGEQTIRCRPENVPEGFIHGRLPKSLTWYTNGTHKKKFIYGNQPEGWYILQDKSRKWYTNGVINKSFIPGTQPEGWYRITER